MNYYEHHLGDYAEATAHLSFLEDAAYSRLIRKYYATEKPIPADLVTAQRLVGARSKEERAAVETVLHEFFVLRDDGWHQDRCDAEITRYRDGEPEREAKKANEQNRLLRHRQERSQLFKAITGAGLHAPWNAPMSELRKLADGITATDAGNTLPPLPETAPATPATATQTPVPRHQSPDTKEGIEKKETRVPRAISPRKTPIPDGFAISDRVAHWAASKGHMRLADRLEHFRSACKAKGYTYADWDEAFMTAIRDDWAKFTTQAHQARAGPASRSERNAKAMQEFLDDTSPNPFAGQQPDRLTIDG